jgi:hypothetical protein
MKPQKQITSLKLLNVNNVESVCIATIKILEIGEPHAAPGGDNLVATTMTLMSNRVCKRERSSILTRE